MNAVIQRWRERTCFRGHGPRLFYLDVFVFQKYDEQEQLGTPARVIEWVNGVLAGDVSNAVSAVLLSLLHSLHSPHSPLAVSHTPPTLSRSSSHTLARTYSEHCPTHIARCPS